MNSSNDSHHFEQEALLFPPDDSTLKAPQSMASEQESKAVSMPLHRSFYIFAFVLGYAGLAIFAWTVTCILSYRPITTDHYGVFFSNESSYGNGASAHSLYVKNEQWFKVARIIQTIVTVSTIPLTSAVCSKAAVVFVQRQTGLTLRQTIVLADKGWTAPKSLLYGIKRYGSSFLFLAISLNILGGIISPLQSLFLTSKTIKTPTSLGTVIALTDIMDPFNPVYGFYNSTFVSRIERRNDGSDSDMIPEIVRSIITSTVTSDPQSYLWTGSAINCSTLLTDSNDTPPPISCRLGAVTLGNMSTLPDPFLAQLPSGYSTGLIRQFLLRINSSATREVITDAEFPANCDLLPGSFYVNYANAVDFGNWSLIACMPANQKQSPWKAVRTRQDFSEVLYLNLSVSGPGGGVDSITIGVPGPGGVYKITLNTTAGYFELPNYMNGQVPGPLLYDGPNDYCGHDCISQGLLDPVQDHITTSRRSLFPRDANETNVITNSSLALEMSINRGPLLTTAIALFGQGSFISERLAHPEAYITNFTTFGCVGQAPLIGLLRDSFGQFQMNNTLDPCIDENLSNQDLQNQITMFISSLYYNSWDGYGGERIVNAFEAAAFLANKAWLQSAFSKSFTVSYDAGADTLVPVISRMEIILISALLVLYLLALLDMALYSAWMPGWSGELDAFAMMRIGAAIAESLPFRVAESTDKIQILDETPGWVGDVTNGKGEVGELGLGGPAPLRGRREYVCY